MYLECLYRLQILQTLEGGGYLKDTSAVWVHERENLAALSLMLLDMFGSGRTGAHVDPIAAVNVALAVDAADAEQRHEVRAARVEDACAADA